MQLKNRNQFVPGGFKYLQAETGFETDANLSFNVTVEAIRKHRAGNPWLAKKHGWSLDSESIASELDVYTATRLAANPKWEHFIREGGGGSPSFTWPPSRPASVVAGARRVAAGVRVLLEWLGQSGRPVDRPLAEKRAAACVSGANGERCPHNSSGDWTSFFTNPASELIRTQLGIKHDMQLVTNRDEELGVCSACLCPMKLKVHVPLNHVLAHTPADVMAKFPEHCWIRRQDQ